MTDVTQNQENVTPATQQDPAHTPTPAATGGSPKREYTQAELDDLFQERAKRAETATMNRVLKLLGVTSEADIPTLKTTIDKARELEKSAMTDQQRLEKERDDAKREKEEAIAQRDAERLERRNDRIASALTSAAGKIKANDTDDVLRYARDKHGEALNALMDDSGAIDLKKVDALLEKIKADKPHYFTAPAYTPGSQSNANGRVIPSDAQARQKGVVNTRQTIKSGF